MSLAAKLYLATAVLTTRGVNTAKQGGSGSVFRTVRHPISHLDTFSLRRILINGSQFERGWLWGEVGEWLSQGTARLISRDNDQEKEDPGPVMQMKS